MNMNNVTCSDEWHQRLQPTRYSCPTCKTPSLPTPAHCDGDLDCKNTLVSECCCNRCEREKHGTADRFYCCSNLDHRQSARVKHNRIVGRNPEWTHNPEPTLKHVGAGGGSGSVGGSTTIVTDAIPKSCGGTGDFDPSDELDKIPLGTAQEERQRAKNWFNSYAQESRNTAYYRDYRQREVTDVNKQLSLTTEHLDSVNRRVRSLEMEMTSVASQLVEITKRMRQ